MPFAKAQIALRYGAISMSAGELPLSMTLDRGSATSSSSLTKRTAASAISFDGFARNMRDALPRAAAFI